MKRLSKLLVIGVLFSVSQLSLSVSATDLHKYSHYQAEKLEIEGRQHHRKGEYKEAFEKFEFPAAVGYKGAQYFLAMMFLKGEHVDQSIVLGMAWLGVAKEAKVKDWVEFYDQVYAKLSKEQQEHVDRKVKQYIDQYGMSAQNVSCKKRPRAGHKIPKIICEKRGGGRATIYYDVERVYKPFTGDRKAKETD